MRLRVEGMAATTKRGRATLRTARRRNDILEVQTAVRTTNSAFESAQGWAPHTNSDPDVAAVSDGAWSR